MNIFVYKYASSARFDGKFPSGYIIYFMIVCHSGIRMKDSTIEVLSKSYIQSDSHHILLQYREIFHIHKLLYFKITNDKELHNEYLFIIEIK